MLGPHIDAIKGSGHVVVWQCDLMHGYVLQENGWLLSPLSPSLTPTVQKHSVRVAAAIGRHHGWLGNP
jgi:3-deoxy-D-arabino-heptulosonate 7-phosphate (DAHP) synthase class II